MVRVGKLYRQAGEETFCEEHVRIRFSESDSILNKDC